MNQTMHVLAFIIWLSTTGFSMWITRILGKILVALLAGLLPMILLELIWPASVNPYIGLRGLFITIVSLGILLVLINALQGNIAHLSTPKVSGGQWIMISFATSIATAIVWAATKDLGTQVFILPPLTALMVFLVSRQGFFQVQYPKSREHDIDLIEPDRHDTKPM